MDEYELLEMYLKDRKDSENLPLHFIPKSYYENVQLPIFTDITQCIADNSKNLLKKERWKKNLLFYFSFHYIFYRRTKFLRCIAIKDDNNTLGPCIIEETKPEIQISHKLLPPEEMCLIYGNGLSDEREMKRIIFHLVCLWVCSAAIKKRF